MAGNEAWDRNVFRRWRQWTLTFACAAAIRRHVKLLWPLIVLRELSARAYFTDYRNVAAEMCTCRTTRILRYRDSLASHQWCTRSSMKALLTTTSHWYDFPPSWRSMTTSSRSVCPAHPHLPMPTASLSDGATMVSKTWLFDCPIPTPIQFINLYV